MLNKPSLLIHGKLKFLIMDAPARDNAEDYAVYLNSIGVRDLVRTCEGVYDTGVFESYGVRIHDLYFQDGTVPPRSKIAIWLNLVKERSIDPVIGEESIIAVHCLAGLGRAPVLVGLALIEYGMDSHEAILLIRKNRPGALNAQQVRLLSNYKRTKAFTTTSCCIIF